MDREEEEDRKLENYEANPPHLDGVPDMSSLIYLEAQNVLHNLEVRYRKMEVYTSISKVLIAVNPYQKLDCYGPEIIKDYRIAASNVKQRLRVDNLPPHVFKVSQAAFHNLLKTQTNQSMIVCGESGSGKTESAKHLMRYLASSSEGTTGESQEISIEKQVLDANPILESFGNAKTVLNNNSSRFGKFTKIVFTQNQDRIIGSSIETYLLEKSRVVKQDLNERNYHIYYMLFSAEGILGEDVWKELMLSQPQDFHYVNQSGCITADGWDDRERFLELMSAFKTLKFKPEDIQCILKIVGGILHLGNVPLGGDDPAVITDNAALNAAANLFGLKPDALAERILTKTLKVVTQTISKKLSLADARLNRDAMAKALYHGLFQFVVHKINEVLYEEDARSPDLKWIGILDVFGFESFEHNSLEQFCINFANERLQQFFNSCIIKSEQEEYMVEAIRWVPIEVPDNQDVIELISKPVTGILAVLDSECQMPKGSAAGFIQNLFKVHRVHARMRQVVRIQKKGQSTVIPINGFSINHYAGKVIYNVDDFLVKNADSASTESATLFEKATNPVAAQILSISPEFQSKQKHAKAQAAPKTAFRSTGGFFCTQLGHLMHTLSTTTPYFVRCIKPNSEKKPLDFNWAYVRPQLECGGIIECLRMLKCGYPTRTTYETIFQRYGKILQPTPPDLNKRDFCEAILRVCGQTLERSEFQLGLTKVFFRPGKQEFLETLLQGPDLDDETIGRVRRFLLNKRFQRARGAIRVHCVFHMMIRTNRARARLKRLFDVGRIVSNTVVHELQDARLSVASTNVQAAVRAVVAQHTLTQASEAARQTSAFFMKARLRQTLAAELDKRIQKKIALQSAREQEERRRKERERMEAAKRAAEEKAREAEEEYKRKKEAEEKARREKEEAVRKEAEERARKLLELEERERKLREKELEDAPLRDRLAELERQEQHMKERLEQFEAEKAIWEVRKSATPAQVVAGEDTIAQFVTKPARFLVGDEEGLSSIDPAVHRTIIISVTEQGEFTWCSDPKPEQEIDEKYAEAQLGAIGLLGLASLTTKQIRNEFYLLIRITNSEGTQAFFELKTLDEAARNQWATAIRYAARNVKASGSISPKLGDPARGNWLAAELFDRLLEAEIQLRRHQDLASSTVQTPDVPRKASRLSMSASQAPHVSLGHGATSGESMKDLEEQVRRLRQEKKDLLDLNAEQELRIEELTKQLEEFGGEDRIIADVGKKRARVRESVDRATEQVIDAEKKFLQRQEVLRDIKNLVAARERDLKATENTMKVLGLNPDAIDPSDQTAMKLKKIKEEQKAKYDKAVSAMLEEYSGLVQDAELLNQKNEELKQKNVLQAQHEQAHQEIERKRRQKKGQDDGCLLS